MSKMSEHIRTSFGEADDVRDEGLTTPDDVVRYDDILYGADQKWQTLDIYRPQKAEGRMIPVIVSVHGGGWVYGDKERYQYYCMGLAQRGFAVVNFTYRLAPEFKFPCPVEDTNMVFDWVLKHTREYGLDEKNIFAVGDSAGAHTLGLYAAILSNPEYAGKYAFKTPEKLRLNAVILNCGMGSFPVDENQDDMISTLLLDYLPEKGNAKEMYMISLADHITENYPPVFLATAAGDYLKQQALAMAEKFMQKKVPFMLGCYGSKDHELSHVFHLDIRSDDAQKCNEDECNFLRMHICN